MLHIHQRKNEMDKEQTEVKEAAERSAVASIQTSGLTGAGEDNCKLSIVPVQVKARKENATVHAYAFLDPGSTASFCTVGLMHKLNLQGRRTNIMLRTMGQRKGQRKQCWKPVLFLTWRLLDWTAVFFMISQAKTLPVHKGNIPHQNYIDRWTHLRKVPLTEIDSEIELLIGSDVPKALEPLDVIWSVEDGPYAGKTMLGWTINGLLGEKNYAQEQSVISVHRISVVKLDELWEQQFKTDFPECVSDNQEPSKADQQFLNLISKSVKLFKGHYCIGLPLKGNMYA